MAQLHQKEAELAKYKVICDEFQKARSRLDAQSLSLAEKDKKIAMLIGQLNWEKRSNGSVVADAISDSTIKRLNDQLEEHKRQIKSRDDEIARLYNKNKMQIFMTKSNLDEEQTALKEKYDQLHEQNSTYKSTIEELVKRVKAKELTINLLKAENEEYRNRETQLNTQVNALKHTIESCDIGNKNPDVNVPKLLAKLADYEAQAHQFQNQQKQQTSPDEHQLFTINEESASSEQKKFDDETTTVSNDSSMGMGDPIYDDDDDDSTFVVMKSLVEEVTDGIRLWCY